MSAADSSADTWWFGSVIAAMRLAVAAGLAVRRPIAAEGLIDASIAS
jgi:hypothetical protein